MNITGNGTVTVTAARGTVILANPQATDANATINIGGSDNNVVNNNDATNIIVTSKYPTSVDGNDGIEATTHGIGQAAVNIGANVTGKINVQGSGNGIWIDSLSTGNVVGNILATGLEIDNDRASGNSSPTQYAPKVITATGNLTTTTGSGVSNLNTIAGIMGWTAGAGTVTITNAAKVNTTGDYVDGINTRTENGDNTVTNSGTITTDGNYSHGIIAEAAGTGGTVDVQNFGAISTVGSNSAAISSKAVDAESKVINTGSLTTGAINSPGIYATSQGPVTVDTSLANDSKIMTVGDNSQGIAALSTGAGAVKVTNNENIETGNSTTGSGSTGIEATSGGNVSVENLAGGDIRTNTDNSMGINATTNGSGMTAEVDNAANVTTYGQFSTAIDVNSNGKVTVIDNGGMIATNGEESYGIHTHTDSSATDGSGDNTVDTTNATSITTYGTNSAGIFTEANAGKTTINNDAPITTNAANSDGISASSNSGDIEVHNSATASITTYGDNSAAISSTTVDGASTVINKGELKTYGLNPANLEDSSSPGIVAASETGPVYVDNKGKITTVGDNSQGIAATSGANDVTVLNGANIQTGYGTTGIGSTGIRATSAGGNVTVTNSAGTITTNGNEAMGIAAVATGPEATSTVNTTSTTSITTSGPGSPAILSVAYYRDNTVTNAAALTTTGDSGDFSSSDGILASSITGKITVTNFGDIRTEGAGGNGIEAMTSSGDIEIDNSGSVTSNQGVAILATAYGDPKFTLNNTGTISGVTGVQISDHFTPATINNAGTIGASTDLAIDSSALTTSGLYINNSGTINGYVTLGTGVTPNILDNSGIWNLSNYNSRTGVQGVAVADFGSGGNNTITNTGTITLSAIKTEATTVVATGPAGEVAYAPLQSGSVVNATMTNQFNDPAVSPVVQGQILGVQTFYSNPGSIIDLTANPVAGDVLVITGGHTAGQYEGAGGVFVANGGTIRLNTVLNGGGANSQSDMLVVDSTQLGSAATNLAVNGIGGGALTTGNGIALVEVLNKNASASGVFTLSNRLAAGPYEYSLYQNGLDGDRADGNWYLRSNLATAHGPWTAGEAPHYRIETSVYTAMPSLALLYGHDLLDTLHERVGEEEDIRGRQDLNTWTPKTGAWARVFDTHGTQNGDALGIYGSEGPKYDYDFFGLQVGQDLFRKEHDNGSRDHAGLYFAYGHADSNVMHFDGTWGRNQFGAYSLGAYWTHFGQSGWYTDAVVQGTYYDATSSTPEMADMTTHGSGFAASLEGGKPFRFGHGYFIEPQAQVTYQIIDFADANIDSGNTQVSFSDADSLTGRIGARLGHDWNLKRDRQLTVWLRPNLWHEFRGDPTTDFSSDNGPVPFRADLGTTWGELNLGISGQANDLSPTFCTTSLYANVSYDRSFDGDGYAWTGKVGIRFSW